MTTRTVPQVKPADKPQQPLQLTVPPLLRCLTPLVDWRKRPNKIYALPVLLIVLLAGLLCGKKAVKPIARWCRALALETRAQLGLPFGRQPSAKMLDRVLAHLDPDDLEAAIRTWLATVNDQLAHSGLPLRVAIDGKAVRGAAKRGTQCVHLLAAVCHELHIVWAQVPVDSKTNEITQVLPLLQLLCLEGRLVTMDALLTQREIAQGVIDRHGDYLMVVKANQPQLRQDIAMCFESEPLADEVRGTATMLSKGHGRLETREIVTSTALKGFIDWPGAEQIMQITRTVLCLKTGEQTTKQVYAITSLPPERGSPQLLLEANRDHWTIENRVHWVRDVQLGEDACAVHKDRAPQVFAALRNVVLALLRLAGQPSVAAAIDFYSAQPERALVTIGCTMAT
jgi:predicted transposase YbfD/YdcC